MIRLIGFGGWPGATGPALWPWNVWHVLAKASFSGMKVLFIAVGGGGNN